MLQTKDEEKDESEVDEKVKEVRENPQLMHADMVMTMGWNETQTRIS